MTKVFIDGSAGTTGLRIFERLGERKDIELISLSEEMRKDLSARKEAINSSDISFLCLPDAAAIEAVSLVENPDTVILDTSTAHRTQSGWAYGFPELSREHFENVKNSKRVAVPGCHASGFIALIYPLVENGILSPSCLLTCHSITGFSGGGKKMIAQYGEESRSKFLDAPRQYGITQQHKHLKEMKFVTGIDYEPVFSPIVADFYSGMELTVPLFKSQLKDGFTVDDIKSVYSEKYNSSIVRFVENADEEGFLTANALSGRDDMQISVYGNEERIILVARYDNLGKGASGAAIECMNIIFGSSPDYMLNV